MIKNGGKPVLLKVYSNYWLGCMSLRPKVDGLEKELRGKVNVIRLDIRDTMGKYAAEKYRIKMVPFFMIFDNNGGAR